MLRDFHATWGAKWASVVSECDRDRLVHIWAQETKDLSDEEIIFAVVACRRMCAFPPSIHEFLCIAYDFYDSEKAFELAWNFELGKEAACSARDYILARARMAVAYIFTLSEKYNSYCASNQIVIPHEEKIKIWNKRYKQEIKNFLKARAYE